MLQDPYIHSAPPKTTGREHYGEGFVSEILQQIAIRKISLVDCIATSTMFTAKSIELNVINQLPKIPECLIIGGGGSQNRTLLRFIKSCLSQCKVMTNEELEWIVMQKKQLLLLSLQMSLSMEFAIIYLLQQVLNMESLWEN